MTKKEIDIWKSYGYYSLEELEEIEKEEKEFLKENYPDTEFTDYDITEHILESIDEYFGDEVMNLDKTLNGRIIAIANVGLWNGRRTGYKVLGDNLNEILTSSIGCDEKRVYCDRYNVYAEGYHHDGHNFVEFRELREDTNYDILLDKLYSGEEVSRSDINRYTGSIRPRIKEVYGV